MTDPETFTLWNLLDIIAYFQESSSSKFYFFHYSSGFYVVRNFEKLKRLGMIQEEGKLIAGEYCSLTFKGIWYLYVMGKTNNWTIRFV